MKRNSLLALLAITFSVSAGVCSAQAPAERMQQVAQSYADAGLFMGSVLVAENGKVLLSKGYGWADVEWNIPNSPTTRFLLASMTKQFTAASILLLEDRGKLKTDDLVKKYIPTAPATWDKITIYHLLTHTSGIPDAQVQVLPSPPEETVLHIREMPLSFQPGERWEYSSVVYALLGYLVEKISGQAYADFVRENIFKPLGMNDSGFDTNVAIIPHRASGYRPGVDGIENAERTNLILAFSAGALYSTTEDLLRWEERLFGGKLLTPASLHKMTTPFRNNYACGLNVRRVDGHLMVEHSGQAIGFNADMAYYPEEKLAVIVLGNLNSTAPGKLTAALAAEMHGETAALAAAPKEIAPKLLARYVGTYEFQGYSVVFVLSGGRLMAQFTGGPKFPVFAESETRFFTKGEVELQFEFSKNDKGEFAFVTQHQNGKETKGLKK